MKNFYLVLTIAGTVIPCAFFGSFLMGHGFNLAEFVVQLFATSPASGFTTDLLITSAAFWIWSFRESRMLGLKNWWCYVALNLGVGLSCSLPLFLYVRQCQIEKSATPLGPTGNRSGTPALSV